MSPLGFKGALPISPREVSIRLDGTRRGQSTAGSTKSKSAPVLETISRETGRPCCPRQPIPRRPPLPKMCLSGPLPPGSTSPGILRLGPILTRSSSTTCCTGTNRKTAPTSRGARSRGPRDTLMVSTRATTTSWPLRRGTLQARDFPGWSPGLSRELARRLHQRI